MEANLNSNNMMQGGPSYLDLQNPVQISHHHPQNPNFTHPNPTNPNFMHLFTQIPESSDQHSTKPTVSDEEETMGHTEEKGVKKGTTWQRMKWTDAMVRLLINAVSYTGEDTGTDCTGTGTRRKFTILQKKGKWKAISKVMGERGCYVSPQQCEDKFNDLNKRYKRLTDILGRGTSCKVVENPNLLDRIDISDKLKDDARKILSSKHLFYEEMCSYHNGNRINLPADPALQKALQLALRNRDENEPQSKRGLEIEENINDDDDYEINNDDYEEEEEEEEEEENIRNNEFHVSKKLKDDSKNNNSNACCGNTNAGQMVGQLDMNQAFLPEASSSSNCEKLQLEKQKLQIQAQMLELERQRFKWERFSKKKDRELQRMKMQNERMRLENERMALELKHKELDLDLQLKGGAHSGQ